MKLQIFHGKRITLLTENNLVSLVIHVTIIWEIRRTIIAITIASLVPFILAFSFSYCRCYIHHEHEVNKNNNNNNVP